MNGNGKSYNVCLIYVGTPYPYIMANVSIQRIHIFLKGIIMYVVYLSVVQKRIVTLRLYV